MLGIKGKWIVCSSEKILENHGLICEGNKIIEILPNEEIDTLYENNKISEAIDSSDDIIIPGFINAHMHQYGILSRGIPVNIEFNDFEGFLKVYWWPYIEDRIKLREVIATTKASAIEMIKSGITGFCDTLEAPFSEEDTLINQGRIIEEIGMRAIVSLESSQRIDNENGIRCLKENEKTIRWFKHNSELIQGAMCTHTTFTCDKDFIKLAKEKAKAEEAIMQFHLSESIYEPTISKNNTGKLPTLIYEKAGALSENTLASQCVKIDEYEINVINNNKVKTVHMPLSNCEVGGGIAPIPKMVDKGICVGLGTDGYINDFFTVMKEAFLIHKANLNSTTVMPSNTVFKMATENGAKALNWENLGILEKGYKADFIILEDKFLSPVTRENIFDQIVVHGKQEYVKTSFINGNIIMKDRNILTIDEAEVNTEVKKIVKNFWEEL